ncbi:protein FAR1-RELATED SEQUENCE 6-like [Juglans microcarpa x Juglans regia]|uniref:protein FAR1-RELATED SEQUENCE 6-like n=1 Tax=Juglans microcarpa x Juglans regia TaxID=2249226 RepID=UPI001B7E054B|nr:protein FAR1-RELATED SEQUENCE 6-like [Juglans microcarpa x Juglans regia]
MDANTEHSDRECDEVEIDTNIECDETIEQPMVGMNFLSVEEVWSYYMKYGKEKGFGVTKRNSRQDDDENVRWICLACVRGGISKSGYTLSKVILDHTHDCSPRKARHFRCFKKVDARVTKRLEINDETGIRLSKNFKSVVVEAGGTRMCHLGRRSAETTLTKLDNFASGLEAYACSKAAYESFGDVIVFDTTYLTNVYKMPFAPFVGVNHHGQSILLGCGLISNEDANTFEWHRFCLWHIMKKLPEKFGSHSQYEEIKSTLRRCIYDSFSELEFESQWRDMLDIYDLHENAWLVSLYSDRRFWVLTYVKDTFWTGMSTTQRSEGMNAFFDDYVNSKTTLKQFVEQYDSALKRKGGRSTFVVADEIQVGDDLLKRATFTVKIDEDPLDVKCSCKLFEFRGISCSHVLRILTQLGKHIVPSKYILDRWRKDVKRKYTFVKSSYDTSSIDDARRYDRIQNCFYELCSNASKSESSCVKLINHIEQLKAQYPGIADPATSMGGTTVDPDTSIGGTTVDPATSMGGTTGRVLSPLVVRSKGRGPSKRKVHPVEKSLKKSSTRRRLHHDEAEYTPYQVYAPDFLGIGHTVPPSQYTPHQIYSTDFFGIGQTAPPSQAQWK